MTEKFKLGYTTLPVLSVYGSRDGMAKMFESTKHNISQNTILHRIDGANHGQFGYYGKHFMVDRPAAISRDDQQSIAEKLALEFIDGVLKST